MNFFKTKSPPKQRPDSFDPQKLKGKKVKVDYLEFEETRRKAATVDLAIEVAATSFEIMEQSIQTTKSSVGFIKKLEEQRKILLQAMGDAIVEQDHEISIAYLRAAIQQAIEIETEFQKCRQDTNKSVDTNGNI